MHKHVQLANIEIPKDVFYLDDYDKEQIIKELKLILTRVLNNQLRGKFDLNYFLNQVIDSTIQVNVEEENYEIAYIMNELKKTLKYE